MNRGPRYLLEVEYSFKEKSESVFEAEEETQLDAFLLAAKMVGYYQRGGGSIDGISVKDTKTGKYIDLPKGLRGLVRAMFVNSFKVGDKVYHSSQRVTDTTEAFTVKDRNIVLNSEDQDTYLISYGNITMLVGVYDLRLATGK